MAEIQNLDVKPSTPAAKVVINARTGSVVMNQAVTLAACAVAHGSLSVTISTTPLGQPAGAVLPHRPDRDHREGRHHHHPAGRRPGADGAGRQARRRRQGAQHARRDAAGPARDPAGDEDRRRADGRARGDLDGRGLDRAFGPAASATNALSIAELRSAAARDPKAAIRETAKQFEALFMQQLMKSMREATLSSGMLDNEGTKLGNEMLDSQYAAKMTGLPGGLTDAIARQLERQMGSGSARPPRPPRPPPLRAARRPRRPRARRCRRSRSTSCSSTPAPRARPRRRAASRPRS